MGVAIRKAGPQDARFLRDMLRHALYWRERVPGSRVSRYVRGWGRPGDTAVIALEGGFAVGAAWYRLFRSDEPGYGFVDEQTPELAIAVVPSKRGRGIGEQLLEALLERARADGHEWLSLSVEPQNPSVKLYERFGFEVVEQGSEAWTMRARVASPPE
ncbi:MAG TPA: GNAT family N-acetyltransferase [Gaiellaceae bacterium]|nr:GNAT family N-acetyltransferase [Gaiellaceae bacterium]